MLSAKSPNAMRFQPVRSNNGSLAQSGLGFNFARLANDRGLAFFGVFVGIVAILILG